MAELSFPDRLRVHAATGGVMQVTITADQARVLARHWEAEVELAAATKAMRRREGELRAKVQGLEALLASRWVLLDRHDRRAAFWGRVLAVAVAFDAALVAGRVLRGLF